MLYILLFVLLPMAALFFSGIRVFTNVVHRTVQDQIAVSLGRMEEDMDTLLRTLISSSNAILTESSVIQALGEPMGAFERDRSLSPTLDTIISLAFRGGVSYTLIDRQGGIYSSWSRNLNDYSFVPDLPIVLAARADPRSTVWSDFEPSYVVEEQRSHVMQISLARSVYEPLVSRSYLGVLVLSVTEEAFADIFRRYGPSTYQDAVALIGADGRIRAAYDPRGFSASVYQAAGSRTTVTAGGQRYLVSRRTLRLPAGLPAAPWRIVSLASADAIDSAAARVTRGLILGFILLLAVLAAIAGVVSTRLVRPIVSLRDVMNAWSLERGDAFAPSTRRDEVGELERSFARMRANIRDLFERASREHEARERYRYQALRSQLNPHFLFNSLNMIRWLALIHKSDPIVRSIDALSGLLSYSMGKDGDWAPLGDELTAVSRYLLIQNHRFGARFDLQRDVEEGLESAMVLRFILQPIVENSVLHGYADAEGGTIRVLVRRREEVLAIEVQDDGIGMPDGLAAVVFQQPRSVDHAAGKVTSLGLFNVNEMIRISCGKRYGLSIASGPGAGCAVRCEIPLRFSPPVEGAGDSNGRPQARPDEGPP